MYAFKILINGPKVADLLQLKHSVFWGDRRPKNITIDDEEDIVEEALVYYKHPSLDPTIPIRITFRGSTSYRHWWCYKTVFH